MENVIIAPKLELWLNCHFIHLNSKKFQFFYGFITPGPVSFGAKRGGATFNFFKDSDNEVYQSMYRYMVDHPDEMTSSNDEGLLWAETKNYAFLMESSSIEYMAERHCKVIQVGGLLDDKGYGIAMRKSKQKQYLWVLLEISYEWQRILQFNNLYAVFITDSSYRNALSEGVLRLQESGKLAALKIKWWKEKKGGGACSVITPSIFYSICINYDNLAIFSNANTMKYWTKKGRNRRSCTCVRNGKCRRCFLCVSCWCLDCDGDSVHPRFTWNAKRFERKWGLLDDKENCIGF